MPMFARVCKKREFEQVSTHFELPSGELREFNFSLFPILDAEGNLTYIGNISHDITEERQARAALMTSRDALHQSEKLAALGSLLAGVSHELNNPLAAVIGQAALLSEDLENTEHADRIAKIKRAADRCARIVQSFLAMARQKAPEYRSVDINEQVRAGVHVATLFSDVAGSMRQAHIGADNRAAGRTAGLLLARMARPPQRHHLLLLSQATRMSGEIERRIGFAQVVEERFPELQVTRVTDMPATDEEACNWLGNFLAAGIDPATLSGVYVVGGATAGVARALQLAGLTAEVPLIAHDFTTRHQAMLLDGSLAYVLHQDIHYCVLTAARVLRGLCENVRGALSVVQPRVEILTAENLH
jgi:hypothetical protein